jgi:hypothetical protein
MRETNPIEANTNLISAPLAGKCAPPSARRRRNEPNGGLGKEEGNKSPRPDRRDGDIII